MVRDSGGGPGGDGQSSRGPEDGVPPEDTAASSQTSRPSEADAPERTDGSQAAATAPGTDPSDRKPDETNPDETGPDETGPVEFDEAFIRAASVTEPAARTRALAARWQQEGYPEREPWRSDEPPAGWFWSRARQGDNGRKRRRRLRRRPWRRKPED
ncbi:hypothetical protein JW613_08860 [Streptomyces smyrnaeus]|uniref:Uncharacterized protein n=1 Tax=Streptomyces smyrnaeus TaxID=1387713 RepID=A0ABS3XSN4_9ACTN|nr:hypothetical protein [Streptomyces smyrnaeus]MBO8198416.1 hypothetical protein [Streptomyces smyrnaeus]